MFLSEGIFSSKCYRNLNLAQIPWGHNVRLLDMVKSPEERLWYAQQTIENGWSRNVLVLQIETGLIHRSGQAVIPNPVIID
jgi:predicted nuclease of restriction endonuclease-like (RecB) superfamily